jgi:hypothetical protein
MADDKKKSGLDNLFDIADEVLGGVEGALGGVHTPGKEYDYTKPEVVEDAEFKDVPKEDKRTLVDLTHDELNAARMFIQWRRKQPPPVVDNTEAWERTWRDDIVWGVDASLAYHAIPLGALLSVCDKVPTQNLTDRKKLEPGQNIKVCTTCVLGVSRRG